MIRNLKALGLAMTVFLALGAAYASGASAQQGKLTSDGPVTLTGTEAGEPSENRLTTTGRFFQCPGSTYTGHKVATTPHQLIPNGATEATLTPHYKQAEDNCTGTGGSSSTVHMNGCDYVVKLGAAPGTVAGTYGVTFDIVCPAGKEITVTIWYSKADHTNNPNNPRCTMHVPEQKGLAGAHATDEGNGHVKLSGTVEGIKVTKTGVNDPLFVCLTGEDTSAEFDLNVTVSGHNSEGGATSISLFSNPVQEGRLTSDGPVTLTGTEVGVETENRLTLFGRFFQCLGSTYTGHKLNTTPQQQIPSGATEVTIAPHYKQTTEAGAPNCKGSSNSRATVSMNGCDYVGIIGAPTASATYPVMMDIVCPIGKEITISMWYTESGHTNNPSTPNCTMHIPEQGGLTGLHATDEGNGHIKLSGAVEGITLRQTAPNDPLSQCTSTHEGSGRLDLNLTVEGHDEAGEAAPISLSHG